MKFLRGWRPRQLLLAWSGYWLGLALITLGPAIPAIVRATRPDAAGNITASMGDTGLSLTVMSQGTTIWQGTASLVGLAFWILAPPFALWLAWLAQRPKRRADAPAQSERPALGEPPPDFVVRSPAPDVRQREM